MTLKELEKEYSRERRAARRQHKLWKEDHLRGHAKEAKHAGKRARQLKAAISHRERERLRKAPKVMFDDVSLELIPGKAPAVAGYVNGNYETWPEVVDQFPDAHKLSIAVNAGGHARCLDIETGDAVPAQAPDWVRGMLERHPDLYPVLYGSISLMPEILTVMLDSGFKRNEFLLWSAHYTFHPHICGPKSCGYATECDATQWTDLSMGRSLDESRLKPHFFVH
jgi:hypothetical protein